MTSWPPRGHLSLPKGAFLCEPIPFFQTLYDETAPVGSLGRGTHYSVLRAVVFHDEFANPLETAKFLDFAIIWDEDHDERVLLPIERLYRSGDLSSFVMLGERKGMFFCQAAGRLNGEHLPLAKAAVAAACKSVGGDHWPGHINFDERAGGGTINDNEASVDLYLKTIKMLWKVGQKEVAEPEEAEQELPD